MGCALDETLVGGPSQLGPISTDRESRIPAQFGRYTVKKLIGRGAMGEVYLAQDEELHRLVAIKTPQLSRTSDPTMLARFRREAQLAAALSHPNICSVYDVGDVDGMLYYTMAYIDGWPLTRWISDRKPIHVRQAANLVRKLALAMAYAHRQGIVHRDLKPANVMIDRRGEPVIMDFGLARQATLDSRLTQSNMVVGTPAYLAPELVAGQSDAPATDIYALGVVFFELLTKRLPFEGHLGEMLAQITRDPAPAPSNFRDDITPELDEVCRRTLEKKPGERFASMEDFAEALSAAFRVAPSATTAPIRIEPIPSSEVVRKRRRWWAVGAVVASVTLGAALVAPYVINREPLAERDADTETTSRDSNAKAASDGATATPDSMKSPGTEPTAKPDVEPADSATPNEPVDLADATAGAARPQQPMSLPEEFPAAQALPTLVSAESAKPQDPPQIIVTFEDRLLVELKRIGDERRRILRELTLISARLNDELPKNRTVVSGDLLSVQRLGEEATAERTDVDRRITFLSNQRKTTSVSEVDKLSIDRELQTLANRRVLILERLQRLELEARGKIVQISKFDNEILELRRTVDQTVLETQRLIDQAFWTADPCGSLGPAVHQKFAAVYGQWLRENPDQVEILALRSLAVLHGGQPDAALKDAQRACSLQSKSGLALAVQGFIKVSRGQTSDGIAEITRATRLAPQAPYPLFLRGLANRARKNHTAALDDFAKAATFAPLVPWTKAQWALQLAASPSDKPPPRARAIELAQEACTGTQQESWLCLEALAVALAANGRFQEAAESESAALALAPAAQQAACRERSELFRTGQPFVFER